MERVERGADTEVNEAALGAIGAGAGERTYWTPPDRDELPVEPAIPSERKSEADKAVLHDLLSFHMYGRRPGRAADTAGLMPALLHPYRDLTRVRHEYPVLFAASAVTTLTAAIDTVLSGAAEGDAGGQFRHSILRLESIMRSLLDNRPGERLSVVWDRAAATLYETSNLPDDKAAALKGDVARARAALPEDGELLSCGSHAAERIFRACADTCWAERCATWRDELDALVTRLRDVLVADFDRSEEARTPEHLRDTLGTASEDVDVQAMSSILRSAAREGGLSAERRERVRRSLSTLEAMMPVFHPGHAGAGDAPIRHDVVYDTCQAARDEHARRMRAMTDLFRSVRIARLEIQNHYRDAVHDPFFAEFAESHLTAEERALCPPVLVRIATNERLREEPSGLLDILGSTAAIKVLVEIADVYDVGDQPAAPSVGIGWPARLSGLAVALNTAYVAQVPVSRATLLGARMLDGLRFGGPALFAVAVPAHHDRGLPVYLAAAAATESRCLPMTAFDPSRGETLAECVDLDDNPNPRDDWPVEPFAYRTADGADATVDLAFTPADLMLSDARLAAHFRPLPPESWHGAMMPLRDVVTMPPGAAAGRIPYVLAVDRDNQVVRVAVARPILELSRQCRAFWLRLRESGGIDNSFVARALATERERLAADKEREVAEIEKNYLAQLDQDVGELTKEIVQRIASQLMGAESAGVSLQAPPPAPARVVPAAVEAPAAGAETRSEAEEEERLSFDDPYIDTPLCTSCNECTQLNPRIFAYDANKQAEIKDAAAGPFSDLVRAAELCPVHIIHPGKPRNPGEAGLEEWIERAQRYN